MLKSTFREPQSNITHIGAAARSLLAPGQSGQVLAAFSNVIYLQTASGELVWVASGDAPLHRRCLKVPTPLPRLGAGAPFSVQDHCLKISPGLVLDSAAATLWQAPWVNRNQVVGISEIPGRVRALAAGLDFSQARGLGRFIPELLTCGPELAGTGDPLTAQAKPLLLDMAAACRSQDRQRIVLGAEALIGFGAGLTPSGDDFLGGLLFGMRNLFAVYPGFDLVDMAIIGEPYRSRTNPISFTLLDDLAKGHGIEPLHRIVNGILEGEFFDNVHFAIGQVIEVGHSTGWDMLAGLFTGLLLAEASDPWHVSLATVRSVQM